MRDKFGLTVIELIMVIVLMAVLAVGTAPFITAVVDRWQFIQFRDEVGTQARLALDWMVREIREVKDKNSFSIADASQIKFTNSDSVLIEYSLSGNTLLRNTDSLATNVSSLQFEYRNKQNNVLGPLPLPAGQRKQIYRITVTITVSSSGESLTLKSEVFPRNLGGA
jgi:type II secretory pathway pseudopilin PulG